LPGHTARRKAKREGEGNARTWRDSLVDQIDGLMSHIKQKSGIEKPSKQQQPAGRKDAETVLPLLIPAAVARKEKQMETGHVHYAT
jgi:hypothetical protein